MNFYYFHTNSTLLPPTIFLSFFLLLSLQPLRTFPITLPFFHQSLTYILMIDIVGIHTFKFEYELGRPFYPYEQLMGVLPSGSRSHIPIAYRVRKKWI